MALKELNVTRKNIFAFFRNNVKMSDIFNYFDILPRYILSILINLIIILGCVLPAMIFAYYKYGPQLITTIIDSINDPYYKELIDSYFNSEPSS